MFVCVPSNIWNRYIDLAEESARALLDEDGCDERATTSNGIGGLVITLNKDGGGGGGGGDAAKKGGKADKAGKKKSKKKGKDRREAKGKTKKCKKKKKGAKPKHGKLQLQVADSHSAGNTVNRASSRIGFTTAVSAIACIVLVIGATFRGQDSQEREYNEVRNATARTKSNAATDDGDADERTPLNSERTDTVECALPIELKVTGGARHGLGVASVDLFINDEIDRYDRYQGGFEIEM